ncbi:MAG: zinc-ribbon domain-containing protein, partial [Lachnospiraceae bacterium]|nr:zinc-ribbon domain-containing protein [Lachnospiraceae bacterium]
PYRAGQSVFWKCFRGHSFKMTMGLKKEGQCPYCSGHKVLVGFNDLKSCNPELASEWDYERNAGLTDVYGNDISTPDKVTCGSGVKVWWHGKCGHFWQAKICDRNLRRGKCPYCRDR